MAYSHQSAFPEGLVLYQIYPRSFNDYNNDGIGDLAGITAKLDYLAELDVGAIWLCPVYPSPMIDFGYDVSNYESVDPVFGSLDDLDTLVREAHSRGILVILDMVFNHTSDQHPWFLTARADRTNDRRDWYIWADGQNGGPPNNWLSVFGGSAWELDASTGQYYLHSFAREQPDLNWHNPAVRKAIKEVMRFWLARGIDGFRMDAVMWYAKDVSLADDPPNPNPPDGVEYDGLLHTHSRGWRTIYGYLKELTDVIKPYGNRFMLLEAQFNKWLDNESYLNFYDKINSYVAAPFNFIDLYLPWEAERFKAFFDEFERGLKPGETGVFITGNHDRPRLATRIGHDGVRAAAMLFLMLPGVTVIYYGDEIGMEDAHIASPKDVYEKNLPGKGLGRDPQRTPMQWSAERYAGFSAHEPWLPVGENYRSVNVAAEAADPDSLLSLYRKLIRFRRASETVRRGRYEKLHLSNTNLMGFVRVTNSERLVVVVNFSHKETIVCPVVGELVMSTVPAPTDAQRLAPLEGRIYRVDL